MAGARSRRLYRIAITVAVVSFVLGCWRVFVERDVRLGIFWQLVFPLLVLWLAVARYRSGSRT